MKFAPVSRLGAAVCSACLMAAAPAIASPAPDGFSSLFVLGDSLSDDGNLFALTGGLFPPSPPYYMGRLSNGPVAVEHLATGLGLAGTPAYVNLAVAGAKTGTDGQFPGTGMQVQAAQLLMATGNVLPSSALFVVWGGANDLRGGASVASTVENLSGIVSTLHAAGARNFLLPNLPDLGLTPEARERGQAFADVASFASEIFNGALRTSYDDLAAQWTDERFFHLDAMGAQRGVTAGAPANGFTDVSSRCFDENAQPAPTVCATPNSYLYWDNIHPTAVVHQILGSQMLAAVTAPVPEPGAMLLMATGVLALLGLQRRRQRAAA